MVVSVLFKNHYYYYNITMDESLQEFLIDSGALNEVHSLVESLVESSVTTDDLEGDEDAHQIANKLLELNGEDLETRLDALVRDAKLHYIGQVADGRWPELLEFESNDRQAIRNLNALYRLPFTFDTYSGTFFQRLTKGLEYCITVDPLFEPALRIYAKLVNSALDCETTVESFASLCEAVHLRCCRRPPLDQDKTIALTCLMIKCLPAVCHRGVCSKNVKPAVVEFVAAVSYDYQHDVGCAYSILCRADPIACWFNYISKNSSIRTAFFDCLHADKRFMKTVLSGFLGWMRDPKIPKMTTDIRSVEVIRYACCLHAVYLLAKMYEYERARTIFPMKITKTIRIHPINIVNCCLGFLSANCNCMSHTLTTGLYQLAAVLAAYHPEIIEIVVENVSRHSIKVLAQVAVLNPEALNELFDRGTNDENNPLEFHFKKKYWKEKDIANALVTIATVLSSHSEGVQWLIIRKIKFLETVSNRQTAAELMRNLRCTPLSLMTYHFEEENQSSLIDWMDPKVTLSLSIAFGIERGRNWLIRTGLLYSADKFMQIQLRELTDTFFDSNDNRKSIDLIVKLVYSICTTTEGLHYLISGYHREDDKNVAKLANIFHLSYENFDDYSIPRDVLIFLWLRCIQAATHSFISRVYLESQLKYQDILAKLISEKHTEDGVPIVDESVELISKLQETVRYGRDKDVAAQDYSPTAGRFPLDSEINDEWLRTVRVMIMRTGRITGPETVDLIIAYGKLRFNKSRASQLDDRSQLPLSEHEVNGIRSTLRYWSSVSNDLEVQLGRVYGQTARRLPDVPWFFDTVVCTLFLASGNSEDKCIEACAVFLKIQETRQRFWSPAADEDTRSICGYSLDALLQKELPEIYNTFKGFMDDFCLADHADYVDRLVKKYRVFLSTAMAAEFEDNN
ncbi:uncharacterized protein LOC126907730 isoform X2 [Daktulosphaira vitifoliae]|uniref:uncharacterized protein LOC126907730 isoform X2 n=1 Tax=Daktulosphaira vitifoliae TaxID=58002 RepID=UPI0021A99765|nr:uncharacterized protein LOC126907730 isoform X2 [Daktulosphaira vitifoliae]